MARIAPLHSFSIKRPSRPSLRRIGVPDGRDVLAVYFWWVKQRYYRAHNEMNPSIASSVRSIIGNDEERVPLSPIAPTAFETKGAIDDLFGVGGQFD